MCTRRQAINIIVQEKQGTIDALKKQIGNLYDSFVILGFIKERMVLRGTSSRSTATIEWEATPLATQKLKFYNLIPE